MVEIYDKNLRDAGFGLVLLGVALNLNSDISGKIIFLASSLCFLIIPIIRTFIFLHGGNK